MSGVFSRRGAQPPPKPAPAPPPVEADPSMEDILASIRRILNEGEGDATAVDEVAAEIAAAAPETALVVEAASNPASAAGAEPVIETDVLILDSAMMVADTTTNETADANVASTETVSAASAGLGALRKAISERNAQISRGPAISLEDIVREEVRPVLKTWLDANLPAIVERLVAAQIEKLAADGL